MREHRRDVERSTVAASARQRRAATRLESWAQVDDDIDDGAGGCSGPVRLRIAGPLKCMPRSVPATMVVGQVALSHVWQQARGLRTLRAEAACEEATDVVAVLEVNDGTPSIGVSAESITPVAPKKFVIDWPVLIRYSSCFSRVWPRPLKFLSRSIDCGTPRAAARPAEASQSHSKPGSLLVNLLEVDAVAAVVGARVAEGQLRSPGTHVADDLGDIPHLVVLLAAADVEHFVVDDVSRGASSTQRIAWPMSRA